MRFRMLSSAADLGRPALARLIPLLAFSWGPVWAQAPAPVDIPPAAVKYLEHPEGGPMVDRGRGLATNGSAYYGVDINSIVDINVDADKLSVALLQRAGKTAAAERAKKLGARLESLRESAQALKGALESVKKLLELWSRSDTSFPAQLKASATQRRRIFQALLDARRQRLQEGGTTPLQAENEAKLAISAAMTTGPALEYGYNWTMLAQLFNEEIAFAEGDLRKLERELGTTLIGIQAHLIPQDGRGIPLHLDNYNEVPVSADYRYEKLQFEISEEKRQAYAQKEQLARQIEETHNVGEAVLKQLEAEFQGMRADLDKILAGAESARDQLSRKAVNLEQWASADKRRAWWESVQADLAKSPEGERVRSAWTNLEASFDELKKDVEALKAYGDLRKSLAGAGAPDAMNAILNMFQAVATPDDPKFRILDPDTWTALSRKSAEFIAAVEALSSPALRRTLTSTGPYKDLLDTRDALKAFIESVSAGGRAVNAWVKGVVTQTRMSRAAIDLPLPPGNRMQPVISGGQLNTRIDLRRSSPSRKTGDSIRIQYSFSDGQNVLPGGWTDEFSLQSYGWQSDVIASLAFARQAHAPTWKPTAAMNWILSRNAWPTAGQSGLASSELKWFSGAGFSVMPLNAANGQDVQVGLGLTLAFLNNRILVGYGSNLQSEKDKGFVFFSIRVLDFPGLSGPLGTSGVSR